MLDQVFSNFLIRHEWVFLNLFQKTIMSILFCQRAFVQNVTPFFLWQKRSNKFAVAWDEFVFASLVNPAAISNVMFSSIFGIFYSSFHKTQFLYYQIIFPVDKQYILFFWSMQAKTKVQFASFFLTVTVHTLYT